MPESTVETEAEAERIWQDTTEEEDDNISIITRAASLEMMETGSRKKNFQRYIL